MLKYIVLVVGSLMLLGGTAQAQNHCSRSGPWLSGTDSAQGFQRILECAKQRIAEAQSNLNDLSDVKVDIFARERDQLGELLKNRNDDLALANEKIAQLEEERGLLQEENEALASELEKARFGNDGHVAALREANITIDERDAKIADLNARITELEDQRDDAFDSAKALQDQIDNLTADHIEQVKTLQRQIADLEVQIDILTAGNAEQVEKLMRQIADLEVQIDNLTAAHAKQVEGLLSQIADLEVQINNLTKTFVAKIASLECKVDRLGTERSRFFADLSETLGKDSGVTIIGDRFLIPLTVLFPVGSADLDSDGREQMIKVADKVHELDIRPSVNWVLQVNGHTDVQRVLPGGKFRNNWELSTARALTVVELLQDQGVPPQHLAAAGFGEYQPIEEERTREAYAKNRRIELRLTDNGSGHSSNGMPNHPECS